MLYTNFKINGCPIGSQERWQPEGIAHSAICTQGHNQDNQATKMSFYIVFHWGPDADLDRIGVDHKDMFAIWPGFGVQEKAKHENANPFQASCRMNLQRDIDSYKTLLRIVQVSKMRMEDPVYELPDIFIPTSVQILHIWTPSGEELPWDRTKPTKSRVWRQTPPDFLEGFHWYVEYHGQDVPVPTKKRRSEHLKTMYKPKCFKHCNCPAGVACNGQCK